MRRQFAESLPPGSGAEQLEVHDSLIITSNMAPDPVRNEPPPSCLAPLAVHWRVASEQQTTRAAMRRSAPMQRAASPRHRPLAWRDRQSPTDSPHASSGSTAPHTWFKGSAVWAPDKVAA